MKCTQPREAMQVVGKGSTQLLFETSFDVKPPMSTAIGESYEVEITDFKVFCDRVLFKGTVDKTLYYKHPHGKKGKECNTNKEEDKDKKDEKDKKDDNCKKDDKDKKDNKCKKDDKKDDQSKHQQENSCDDSATSTKSCKFLSKIKKYSRKGKTNQQKEKSSEKDNHKCDDKDHQNETDKSERKSSESNELTCLSGSGQLIDSAHGIVHFRQQVLEFAGTVGIPGVRPGDTIHVERAEGSTFEPFVSTVSEDTICGLIDKTTQAFAVDVVLVATRSKPAKHSATKKRRFSSLPADNNAETAE